MNAMTLIVEDDGGALGLYKYALKDEAVYARDIQEAYMMYAQYKPNVIIVDFNLKGETSLDFIQYVKADNANAKIFMVTAYPVDIALKYLKSPVDHIYLKPITMQLMKSLAHA